MNPSTGNLRECKTLFDAYRCVGAELSCPVISAVKLATSEDDRDRQLLISGRYIK
jgi:hypothetical protein